MEKFLLVSEYQDEIHRQLIEDMSAQLQLGKPFHSVKGCIKFDKPLLWNKIPIIQLDFCCCMEWQEVLSIIMWTGRKPDEDDFLAICWPFDTTWNEIYDEVIKREEDEWRVDF